MANLFGVAKLLIHKPIEELLKLNIGRGELLHCFIIKKQDDKIKYLMENKLFEEFYQNWHSRVYNSGYPNQLEIKNVKYILDLYLNIYHKDYNF